MSKDLRKIFVVDGQNGYANWMEGVLVDTLEEADLVVFSGGADINPALYGDPVHPMTHYSSQRDHLEWEAMKKAVALNKKIWGTCRGAQLMCAYNGGKLIQHMSHPSYHMFTNVTDGNQYPITSAHHQMLDIRQIELSYSVLGYTKGLSRYHFNGHEQDITGQMETRTEGPGRNALRYVMEPEIVYFRTMANRSSGYPPSTSQGLCIQGHPEWMLRGGDPAEERTITLLRNMLNKFMDPEMKDLVGSLFNGRRYQANNPVFQGDDALQDVEFEEDDELDEELEEDDHTEF